MVRDVKLLEHLPLYLAEYRQFREVMATEDPEIFALNNAVAEMRNNQYITTCNAAGIKRYEELLGIVPNNYDTVQARITRVLARWVENLPYSYRVFIERLQAICGEGNYRLRPDFEHYSLTIEVCVPLSSQVEELDNLLTYMVPANLHVVATNALPIETANNLALAGYVGEIHHIEIATPLTKTRTLEGQLYRGSLVSKKEKVRSITSNMNSKFVLEAQLTGGGGVTTVIKEEIS